MYYCRIDSPVYLERLVKYWNPSQSAIKTEEAYFFAFGIFFCSFVSVLVVHPYMMGILHVGMKVRIACCSLIYRKTLRLDLGMLEGITIGNVVNLMSNDVNRFDLTFFFAHYLWLAPTQMCVSLIFMFHAVEISAVIGIMGLLIFIPLQAWFGHKTSIFRMKTAVKTDERVRQMNEIIQGMQVIKMYTWEHVFHERLYELRRYIFLTIFFRIT